LACVDAEVQLGCGLDAVGALAEVGDVEIVVQYLLLAGGLLQRDGVAQLLELAVGGLPGGLRIAGRVGRAGLVGEDVLDVLLGQRRAALRDAAGAGVGQQRAQRAHRVDGAVLVEAVVLDVDQGALHDRSDPADRYGGAVLHEELGDDPAVGVVDGRGLRQGGDDQGVRHGVEVLHGRLGAQAEAADERDGQPRDQRTRQHACCEQADTEAGRGQGRSTFWWTSGLHQAIGEERLFGGPAPWAPLRAGAPPPSGPGVRGHCGSSCGWCWSACPARRMTPGTRADRPGCAPAGIGQSRLPLTRTRSAVPGVAHPAILLHGCRPGLTGWDGLGGGVPPPTDLDDRHSCDRRGRR